MAERVDGLLVAVAAVAAAAAAASNLDLSNAVRSSSRKLSESLLLSSSDTVKSMTVVGDGRFDPLFLPSERAIVAPIFAAGRCNEWEEDVGLIDRNGF